MPHCTNSHTFVAWQPVANANFSTAL